jgi:hypothetical protein
MKSIEYYYGYPVKDIKPNPINPRTIRDSKFEKLKLSIKEYPEMLALRELVVDEDFIVLGGNMRLKALKELKIKHTDVVMFKGLTEDEKKEFIIKDNANYGNWDWDMIANLFDAEAVNKYGLNVWQPQEEVERYTGDEFEYDGDDSGDRAGEQTEYQKKPIIVVEFNILDYPVAFELIKELTQKGANIGALLIEKLIAEDENI